MATSAASAAAAAAAAARRELREHFEQANAFDPSNAIAYDPPRRLHRAQFEALVGRGIVKQGIDGRYWFDREAERADQERRRAAAVVILKLILIVLAVSVAAAAILKAGK